jgi:hypothetical protein
MHCENKPVQKLSQAHNAKLRNHRPAHHELQQAYQATYDAPDNQQRHSPANKLHKTHTTADFSTAIICIAALQQSNSSSSSSTKGWDANHHKHI